MTQQVIWIGIMLFMVGSQAMLDTYRCLTGKLTETYSIEATAGSAVIFLGLLIWGIFIFLIQGKGG